MAIVGSTQGIHPRPQMSTSKGDVSSLPFPVYRSRRSSSLKDPRPTDEEKPLVRFVRVEETVFQVPEGFFLQMSLRKQAAVGFTSDKGSTLEYPIILNERFIEQFKQILAAYQAFPALDVNSLTLDHLLTIGEMSFLYGLRNLTQWFLPAFKSIIISPSTPLRTSTNELYVRTLKLSLRYGSSELIKSIQAKWVSRMYWGQLNPITAMIFGDFFGLRDLLGHACYVYLMSVEERIRKGEDLDPQKRLMARHKTYIMSGYYSLRATWRHLEQNPPPSEKAPQCNVHTHCIVAWKLRWAAIIEKPCELSEVDVLRRLRFMEDQLREDTLLHICFSPPCRELALSAVWARRQQVSRDLHHHFDL